MIPFLIRVANSSSSRSTEHRNFGGFRRMSVSVVQKPVVIPQQIDDLLRSPVSSHNNSMTTNRIIRTIEKQYETDVNSGQEEITITYEYE